MTRVGHTTPSGHPAPSDGAGVVPWNMDYGPWGMGKVPCPCDYDCLDPGGRRMARKADKKHLTLSEHLALRAQAAQDAQHREEARMHTAQRLRELDAQVTCNCPACVRLRQMSGGPRT